MSDPTSSTSSILDLKNVALFAAIGSLAVFWQQARAFIEGAVRIVVRKDSIAYGNMIAGDEFVASVYDHLRRSGPVFRFGPRIYTTATFTYDVRENLDRTSTIVSTSSRELILYRNCIPILLAYNEDVAGDYGSLSSIDVTYVAGLFPMRKILDRIANETVNRTDNRTGVELTDTLAQRGHYVTHRVFGSLAKDDDDAAPSSPKGSKAGGSR